VTTAAPASRPRGLSVPAATALVVFSVCCFGSIPILATIARRDGTAIVALLTWRYIGALVSLAAIAGAVIAAPENRRRSWRIIILGGGIQAVVAYLTLAALEHLSAATVGFLFYTYPAWVAVIAAVRRIEKLTPIRLAALALSLTGITVMVGSPWAAAMPIPGLALALGGAVVYAIYIPMIHHLQRGVHPAASTAYIALGALTTFLVISAATGTLDTMRLPSPTSWVAAGLLAVLCTTIAFITFLSGLLVLGPVRTAIVSTVEPFYTAVAGALLLGQPLTGTTVAGGALIAAAVLLLQRGGGEPP
jgi:drug/metabolite transporter (DMT)-like permease